MPDYTLNIHVVGKDDASKILGNLKSGLGDLAKFATGAAVGGFVALAGGIALSTKAAMDAEQTEAQLNAVLKSTKGAAGMSKDAVMGLADALSRVTPFEDDVIIGGENLLLTFTNIGKNVFPDATEVMLDMSQALGQDLKSSAIQLGKALQDPTDGVTALSRVGVNFTDQQKAQIKALVESGKTMEAQKLILAELKTEFGGAAKAAGDTFGGQLAILKNQFGNILETIGGAFLPALKDLAKWINAEILPALQAWANENAPKIEAALRGLAKWIGDEVIPALQQLDSWLMTNLVPAVQTKVLPVVQQLAQWIGNNLPGVMAFLGAAWENVLKPVLQALGDVLGWLLGNAPAAGNALGDVWTQLQQGLTAAWGVVQPILQTVMDTLSKFWVEVQPKLAAAWSAIQIKIQEVWTFISDNIIKPIATAIQNFLTEHGAQLQAMFEDVWNAIGGFLQAWWSFVSGIIKIGLDLISGDFDAAGADWQAMMEGVWAGIKNIVSAAWDFIKNIIVIALVELSRAIGAKMNEVKDNLVAIWNGVTGWLASLPQTLMNTGRNIIQGLIDGFWNEASAVGAALRGIVDGAINGVKQRLGIHSPSTVFAEIGANMARGLVNGFATPQLNFASTLASAGMSGAQALPSSVMGASGNTEFHFHIDRADFSSPQAAESEARNFSFLMQARQQGKLV